MDYFRTFEQNLRNNAHHSPYVQLALFLWDKATAATIACKPFATTSGIATAMAGASLAAMKHERCKADGRLSAVAMSALSLSLLGLGGRIGHIHLPKLIEAARGRDLFAILSATRWLTLTTGLIAPASWSCFTFGIALWKQEAWANDFRYRHLGPNWWPFLKDRVTRGGHGTQRMESDTNGAIAEIENRETFIQQFKERAETTQSVDPENVPYDLCIVWARVNKTDTLPDKFCSSDFKTVQLALEGERQQVGEVLLERVPLLTTEQIEQLILKGSDTVPYAKLKTRLEEVGRLYVLEALFQRWMDQVSQGDCIRQEVGALTNEIVALQQQIHSATDPGKKKALASATVEVQKKAYQCRSKVSDAKAAWTHLQRFSKQHPFVTQFVEQRSTNEPLIKVSQSLDRLLTDIRKFENFRSSLSKAEDAIEEDEDALTTLQGFMVTPGQKGTDKWLKALGIAEFSQMDDKLEALGLKTAKDLRQCTPPIIGNETDTEDSVLAALAAFIEAADKNKAEEKTSFASRYQAFLSPKAALERLPTALAVLYQTSTGMGYVTVWAISGIAHTQKGLYWMLAGLVVGAVERGIWKKEFSSHEFLQGSNDSEDALSWLRIPLRLEDQQRAWLGGRDLWVRGASFGERTLAGQSRVLFSEAALSETYNFFNDLTSSNYTFYGTTVLVGRAYFHTLWETGEGLYRRATGTSQEDANNAERQ